MHYLPFMAAITLFPWWGEEMKAGAAVGVKGKHSLPDCWRWVSWRSRGGVYNKDALSVALYCTLSVIATQIRASHRNHLHTDQCTVQRDDVPAITADLFMWLQQGNGGTAVGQLCLADHSKRTATSNYICFCATHDFQHFLIFHFLWDTNWR